MAQAEMHGADAPLTQTILARAGLYMNVTAALVSLALILGVAVWGYKILVRDVTGVPVVRALDGPMRVPAEEPGGQIAEHEGLAVNAIAEEGEAEGPQDSVILAPRDVDLASDDDPGLTTPVIEATQSAEIAVEAPVEDAPVEVAVADDPAQEAPLVEETTTTAEVATEEAAPLDPAAIDSDADVAMLVAELTAGVEPLSELAPIQASAPAGAIEIISTSIPGVTRSLRPVERPNLVVRAVEQTAAAVQPTEITAGTPLVQLAAMDTAEGASQEWDRLSRRYSAMFAGKQKVIQETQSNGRTFFRLRAAGFADSAEANRFCTALNAEGTGCIPAVAR